MYTILLSGEGGLSQLPILSFRWFSARTLGSHPNFLHLLRREGDNLNFLSSVFDGLRLEPWVLIPTSFILLRREGDYLNFLNSVFDGLRLEPWVLIPTSFILLRREGDSNPRYVTVNTLSKRARSTALPPLRILSLQK